MRQLFISDLHLWEEQPQLEKLFHHFMQQQACQADELYVLGDLFEVWIGDDAVDPLAERVIAAFNNYSAQGGKLYFMHGNRDFLLGDVFIASTGGSLLSDPHSINIAGQSALLMHGDLLCTDDLDYMAYRQQVRTPAWKEQVLSLSISERQEIARDMRQRSAEKGIMMSDEISDVADSEVTNVMQQADVTLLIHGHTHRQARHPMTINNHKAERIVLGDWGETGSVLQVKDGNISLSNFSLMDD